MAKNVNEFLGKGKGDIITLSDLQTQKEFGKLKVDFLIKEVRTYREPGGCFTYTAYIAEYDPEKEGQEPQTIMLLIRQIAGDYDLRVFYMDSDGDSSDFEPLFETKELEEETTDEETEDEDMEEVIPDFDDPDFGDEEDEDDTPEEEGEEEPTTTEDLVERFEVTLHFENDESSEVTWDKQNGSSFGIETTSTESKGTDSKTLAEYFTNDETRGNPYCFIEWTGDIEDGYIEIWYGCEVRPEDVEVFKTK